ncbi:MAG: insulinase family protein [Bacteroidales bacterium]|nr:insulinase family protein [Bacteroidales bacterium]
MLVGKAPCGLRYAVRRSGRAVGYCSLTIKCGTRDEGIHHSGIAHFTEHTIFKGTSKKSAKVINSYLDRLGGDLNAFTTKEEIVLHSTVLKEDLGKAAALLLELATCPTFPEEEIAIEKGVVIDEISSYKDSPADDVYDKFEETLLDGHPLGKPILGTAASVRKISAGELREFVKERFTPGNMALAVVADIDEKKMEQGVLRLAGKVFDGSWAESAERQLTPVETPVLFRKTIEKRHHEVNAVIGGLAPSLYDRDSRFAAILLANIIGGPASNSRLNDLLREKNGWVYGVETSYTQYSDTGVMAISMGCDRSNLEKCLRGVDKVIKKIQDERLSDSALRSAKKQLLGQLAISSDNGETQCLSMGKSLISFGEVSTDQQNREAIEAVSADMIQESARTIFNPESLSSLVFL